MRVLFAAFAFSLALSVPVATAHEGSGSGDGGGLDGTPAPEAAPSCAGFYLNPEWHPVYDPWYFGMVYASRMDDGQVLCQDGPGDGPRVYIPLVICGPQGWCTPALTAWSHQG